MSTILGKLEMEEVIRKVMAYLDEVLDNLRQQPIDMRDQLKRLCLALPPR